MSEVHWEVGDGIAVVTLGAPQRRDALTVEMAIELEAAFDEIDAREDVGAVVLRGSGASFLCTTPSATSPRCSPTWPTAGWTTAWRARRCGGPPGSDPDVVRAHVLDGPGAGHAVLNCLYAVQALHNADWSTALAGALNDWQAACRLAADPRSMASVVVAPHDPRGRRGIR